MAAAVIRVGHILYIEAVFDPERKRSYPLYLKNPKKLWSISNTLVVI